MNPRTEQQLLESAYHEAGHAVAGWLFQIPIRRVSIVRKGGSGGRVTWRQNTDPKHFRRLPVLFQNELWGARVAHTVIVGLAGGIAERYAFPSLSDDHVAFSCSKDFDHVDKCVRCVYGRSLGAELWRNLLEWRARVLVKKHWHLIRCLAEELLRHRSLTGRAAEAILKTADEEYLLSGGDDGYELLR